MKWTQDGFLRDTINKWKGLQAMPEGFHIEVGYLEDKYIGLEPDQRRTRDAASRRKHKKNEERKRWVDDGCEEEGNSLIVEDDIWFPDLSDRDTDLADAIVVVWIPLQHDIFPVLQPQQYMTVIRCM